MKQQETEFSTKAATITNLQQRGQWEYKRLWDTFITPTCSGATDKALDKSQKTIDFTINIKNLDVNIDLYICLAETLFSDLKSLVNLLKTNCVNLFQTK